MAKKLTSKADERSRTREAQLRQRETAIRTAVALATTSPALTIQEAAVFAHVPVARIRELIASGSLDYQPQGKRWLVRKSDIEALLSTGWQRKTTGNATNASDS